jgi:hypothetical protein
VCSRRYSDCDSIVHRDCDSIVHRDSARTADRDSTANRNSDSNATRSGANGTSDRTAPRSSPASGRARAKLSVALVTGTKRRLLAGPPVSLCSHAHENAAPHRPRHPPSRTVPRALFLARAEQWVEAHATLVARSVRRQLDSKRTRSAGDRNRAGPERQRVVCSQFGRQQSGRFGDYCDHPVPNPRPAGRYVGQKTLHRGNWREAHG